MIGIIGAGKLGSTLAKRLAQSNPAKQGIIVIADRNQGKLDSLGIAGATLTNEVELVAKKSDTLILCVKPKDMDGLLQEIASQCKGKLVISVAAGISTSYLEKRLPGARIVRCMPNLASAIGKSETAISLGKSALDSDRKAVEGIFGCLGSIHYIEEGKMAAWTGLSGSYPAYVASFINAAAQVGQSHGFSREESVQLSCRVTLASASLLLETGEDPLDLIARVASPGGTTQAGLKKADELGLQERFASVIEAAISRAKEMEK